jgi:hypothetical protein
MILIDLKQDHIAILIVFFRNEKKNDGKNFQTIKLIAKVFKETKKQRQLFIHLKH